MQKRKSGFCTGIKIEINANNQNYFITEKEVDAIINASGNIKERSIKTIDIASLESALKKDRWIKNVEIYFDNTEILHIDVEQRLPIARLFTVDGTSSYLDKNALRLPPKNTATARVLIVTGFPSDNEVLAHTDSILLDDIKKISNFIYLDTFWNAQIAQIHITSSGTFELIPTIGNHVLLLGDANNLKQKFEKLYTLYTKAWLQNGIDSYEIIDLRFHNQIVATRKGTIKKMLDSLSSGLIVKDSLNIDSIIH